MKKRHEEKRIERNSCDVREQNKKHKKEWTNKDVAKMLVFFHHLSSITAPFFSTYLTVTTFL